MKERPSLDTFPVALSMVMMSLGEGGEGESEMVREDRRPLTQPGPSPWSVTQSSSLPDHTLSPSLLSSESVYPLWPPARGERGIMADGGGREVLTEVVVGLSICISTTSPSIISVSSLWEVKGHHMAQRASCLT